jgi:glycine cleavage system H protein
MNVAVLPCNGLDKALGSISREVAIQLAERHDCELVCPVLLNQSPERYAKTFADGRLLVVDGCATRCATKLANRLEAKLADRIQVADEVKRLQGKVGHSLSLGEPERAFAARIVADWLQRQESAEPAPAPEEGGPSFPAPTEFLEVTHDKFEFKIPATGFVFNENDVWAQVVGNRARVGISDYAQQNYGDVQFCQPVAVGREIDQFDDFASLESSKAMLDLVSPVSGRIVAVNSVLAESPETINLDPYGTGWIVEIELRDFKAERELLLDGPAYAAVVRRKAAEA